MSIDLLTGDFRMGTYKRWPVELVAGSGTTVWDSAGREYLDFSGGIAVVAIGHAHPAVTAAVSEQVGRLVHVSNLYDTGPQKELARRLAGLTGNKRSFFCNSGAEAIECALKLARKRHLARTGGPGRILSASGSFHGRTFGALAATGQPAKQVQFGPMVPGFEHVPYGDPGALDETIGDDTAAVLLEPIQGEAGVVVPPKGYLAAARELCGRHGALLMIDEIQTGMGRTGSWFAYEHDGIAPDVICLAKGLANGLPIGACLADPEVAAELVPGDHASTFGGGPVPCAAAVATLEVIENDELVARAALAGLQLTASLRAVVRDDVEVRGRGLLIGVSFPGPIARAIVGRALELGLLLNDPTPHVVRLSPPLNVTDSEVERAVTIFEEVVHEVRPA
ncbi:MAG: acetylornithine transaminase [Actinomycetota bacterium]